MVTSRPMRTPTETVSARTASGSGSGSATATATPPARGWTPAMAWCRPPARATPRLRPWEPPRQRSPACPCRGDMPRTRPLSIRLPVGSIAPRHMRPAALDEVPCASLSLNRRPWWSAVRSSAAPSEHSRLRRVNGRKARDTSRHVVHRTANRRASIPTRAEPDQVDLRTRSVGCDVPRPRHSATGWMRRAVPSCPRQPSPRRSRSGT